LLEKTLMKCRLMSLKSFNVRTTYGLRRSRSSNAPLISLIETMDECVGLLSLLEVQQRAVLRALDFKSTISPASVRKNLN
jgi:hypothetical protein